MNKKVSGAKLVLVPIRNMGANYFPYVEDLKDRYIKYIDFHPTRYLPGVADVGMDDNYSEGQMTVSLANETGNKLLFNGTPLEQFNVSMTSGIRQKIGAKLSFQNSYIFCQDSDMVGKTAAFVVYYDLPNFSARNTTDNIVSDYVSVKLTTKTFYNKFPDVQRMSGKRFRFVLANPCGVTPDFETGVTSNLQNLYVTLRKGSYNVVENMPLSILYQTLNLDKLEFANIIFDLQSSYITVGGAGTWAAAPIGKSVFFNMVYES